MAFTTTSNFSGKAAGFYISAALKEATSLDYLTIIENVKFKSNIQKMAGSGLVKDASCDFTDAGTLALTEAVLTPKNLQINIDLCKKTLLDSWEALEMRAGAGAPPPATFDDYVISYMGELKLLLENLKGLYQQQDIYYLVKMLLLFNQQLQVFIQQLTL